MERVSHVVMTSHVVILGRCLTRARMENFLKMTSRDDMTTWESSRTRGVRDA